VPSLKAADQWWCEKTNKRRLNDNSPKAYDWVEPFMSRQFVQTLRLPALLERGPNGMDSVQKAVRALVRAKRKEKAACHDLLRELYGAAVLAHLFQSLKTSLTGQWRMAEYVGINDLKSLQIEYSHLGYRHIDTLGKTDIKWLVEVFGELAAHRSLASDHAHIRENAISRFCWEDLNRSNATATAIGRARTSMQDWLNERLKTEIGYDKEWQQRVSSQNERQSGLFDALEAAWAATTGTFIVADLETTGLDAVNDEILEFGAIRVSGSGQVEADFSMLVRTARPVPAPITRLTGISEELISIEGRPVREALDAFISFGPYPVFFHNAPFDVWFLQKAAAGNGREIENKVFDTLPLARCAWPNLDSYKLNSLAEHVGASVMPDHRALADVRATLSVLLAARPMELIMEKA
jgi:DNA polymerase III epsilon subunit-like protein